MKSRFLDGFSEGVRDIKLRSLALTVLVVIKVNDTRSRGVIIDIRQNIGANSYKRKNAGNENAEKRRKNPRYRL